MYSTVDNNSTILFSKDVQTITLHSTSKIHFITIKYLNGSITSLGYDNISVRNDEYSRIADWIGGI